MTPIIFAVISQPTYLAVSFYRWWSTQQNHPATSYYYSPQRNASRDKMYQSLYLRFKGLGSKWRGLGIGFSFISGWLDKIKEDTGAGNSQISLKITFPDPLATVIEMLVVSFVPVKTLGDKITEQHLKDTEEGIKILVRLKMGGNRMPMAFEGEYRKGDSKYWKVSYRGGETPFQATSWGVVSQLYHKATRTIPRLRSGTWSGIRPSMARCSKGFNKIALICDNYLSLGRTPCRSSRRSRLLASSNSYLRWKSGHCHLLQERTTCRACLEWQDWRQKGREWKGLGLQPQETMIDRSIRHGPRRQEP